MSAPKQGQSVHLMSWRDVLRTKWLMHFQERRNIRELELYTTDDLRQLYQTTTNYPLRLRDGIIRCDQIVAEIRWRILWARFGYYALLLASLAAALFAFLAWRFPIFPCK